VKSLRAVGRGYIYIYIYRALAILSFLSPLPRRIPPTHPPTHSQHTHTHTSIHPPIHPSTRTMADSIPSEMRALTVPFHASPDRLQVSTLPVPSILLPTDVLIRVHAASINPIDVKKAAGMTRMLETIRFPFVLGQDVSGVIVRIGTEAGDFQVGDEVYTPLRKGGSFAVPLPSVMMALVMVHMRGLMLSDYFFLRFPAAAADYVVTSSKHLCRKPVTISHSLAAALPTVATTALQALTRAAARQPLGDLTGKTVFIPGALSGTGHIALQLAKRVFNAGHVITTASPGKIPRIAELLGEGTVDQIIDYTSQDVHEKIEKGSVDFVFDTMGGAQGYFSLVKPETGVVISLATVPSGEQAAAVFPETPWAIKIVLNLIDAWYQWRARRWGVGMYEFFFPNTETYAKDLEKVAWWVGEGKLRPVIGRTARLEDLEGVIAGCTEVKSGKGGTGKFVIELV